MTQSVRAPASEYAGWMKGAFQPEHLPKRLLPQALAKAKWPKVWDSSPLLKLVTINPYVSGSVKPASWRLLGRTLARWAGEGLGLIRPAGHHGQDSQVFQRDLLGPLVVSVHGYVSDTGEYALCNKVEPFLA